MTSIDEPTSPTPSPADPDALRSRAIGTRLREIFSEVAAEPVPPSFDELLRRLE